MTITVDSEIDQIESMTNLKQVRDKHTSRKGSDSGTSIDSHLHQNLFV